MTDWSVDVRGARQGKDSRSAMDTNRGRLAIKRNPGVSSFLVRASL